MGPAASGGGSSCSPLQRRGDLRPGRPPRRPLRRAESRRRPQRRLGARPRAPGLEEDHPRLRAGPRHPLVTQRRVRPGRPPDARLVGPPSRRLLQRRLGLRPRRAHLAAVHPRNPARLSLRNRVDFRSSRRPPRQFRRLHRPRPLRRHLGLRPGGIGLDRHQHRPQAPGPLPAHRRIRSGRLPHAHLRGPGGRQRPERSVVSRPRHRGLERHHPGKRSRRAHLRRQRVRPRDPPVRHLTAAPGKGASEPEAAIPGPSISPPAPGPCCNREAPRRRRAAGRPRSTSRERAAPCSSGAPRRSASSTRSGPWKGWTRPRWWTGAGVW